MINKYFLAFFLATALVGCGGGGEDLSANMDGSANGTSGGSTTNQSAEGLWSGYISKGQNMNAVGLILPSGKYYFATGNNYSSLITGEGTTLGSTFNSSKSFYDPDGLFVSSDGKISGTVTTKGNLNAVFGKSNANSSLAYLKSYGSTPTISNLFGKAFSSLYSPSTSFTFPNQLDEEDQLETSFLQDNCYFSAKIGNIANNENNYFSMSLSVYDQPDKIGACKKITDPSFPINGYAVPWTNNNTPHLILIGVDSNQSNWFSSVFKLKD